jgi:DNA repair exonuclease SbcCD nuclease subunit
MKLLFTADIHIKLGQKNVPVDWSINRYNMLWKKFEELQISTNSDLFVIGGDVFDKLPNMQELECYFELVSHCKISTIIYSGNHEMLKKDTTFLSNLKSVTTRLNSLVRIVDECETINQEIDIIPYNCLKSCDFKNFNGKILLTHVRGEIPPHVKAEVPVENFKQWQVVLAGDLHSYENCQANILYPGSPATTSFHRNLVTTGIIEFNTDTLDHVWHKLNLPQLLRCTVKVGDPTLNTEYHHTIYEVEGNLVELSTLEENTLIDKKITKKDTDTALILSPEMTIAEEVKEYLTYILSLPDNTINEVLKEFNNYESRFQV